jgi:hypothetical protein
VRDLRVDLEQAIQRKLDLARGLRGSGKDSLGLARTCVSLTFCEYETCRP